MASAAMVIPAASVARTGTSRTRTLRGSAGALSSANAMRSLGLPRSAFAASFATIGSMITADSLNTAMVQHDTIDRPSGIVKRGVGDDVRVRRELHDPRQSQPWPFRSRRRGLAGHSVRVMEQ